MKFFVYGTLKEGGRFAKNFDNERKSSCVGIVHNMNLFDLGWFPGIRPGDGEVIGEVHEYDREDEVLAAFDRIEGFSADDPENSLYLREEVEVELPDGDTTKAVAYVFNRDVSAEAKKIESGVWEIR